jgi:hypothetical protein
MFGTEFQDVGTCSRTSEIYLPHIWPDLGIKRDCTTVGYWVDSPSSELAVGPQNPFQAITGATATVPAVSGNYLLTYSSGTTAVTLTAPTAGVSDGAMVTFYSTSAEAHTITCTSHIMTGSSQTGVLTFAAHPGAGVTLVAYNGYWIIVANNLVTLTS